MIAGFAQFLALGFSLGALLVAGVAEWWFPGDREFMGYL